MSDHDDHLAEFRPRLCHLRKWSHFQGYGFNLHAEKARNGQFIGKVDPNSPAESAGLYEKDRIIEVNYVNISNENHQQVVKRIRNGLELDGTMYAEEVVLLVVDQETDDYYKKHNRIIRSDDDNVLRLVTPREEELGNGKHVEEGEEQSEEHRYHEEDVRGSPQVSTKSAEPSPNVSNKLSNHSNEDDERNQSNYESEQEERQRSLEVPSNGKTSRTPSQIASIKTPTLSEKSSHREDANNNTKQTPAVLETPPLEQQKVRSATVPTSVQQQPSPSLSSHSNHNNNNVSPRSNDNLSSSSSFNHNTNNNTTNYNNTTNSRPVSTTSSSTANQADPFNIKQESEEPHQHELHEYEEYNYDDDDEDLDNNYILNEITVTPSYAKVDATPKFRNKESCSNQVTDEFKDKAIEAVHQLYDNEEVKQQRLASQKDLHHHHHHHAANAIHHLHSSATHLISNLSVKIKHHTDKYDLKNNSTSSINAHIQQQPQQSTAKAPQQYETSSTGQQRPKFYTDYDSDDVFSDAKSSTSSHIPSSPPQSQAHRTATNNKRLSKFTQAEEKLNGFFQMSAAEFKNYLKNKQKNDPREAHVDIKQKFKIFQEM